MITPEERRFYGFTETRLQTGGFARSQSGQR
jgi:hypothetical protein